MSVYFWLVLPWHNNQKEKEPEFVRRMHLFFAKLFTHPLECKDIYIMYIIAGFV